MRVNVTIEDSDGERFTSSFHAISFSAMTVDQIRTNVHALWDLIMPLVTGILVDLEAVIDFGFEVGDWTNNVVDMLSDVQEKAKLVFAVDAAPDSRVVVTIPTIREVVFTNSGAGKVLDITDTDVAALIAFLTTMGSTPTYVGVDSHDFYLSGLIKGYQWFGKG